MNDDEAMRRALELALYAAGHGDVPVGAVVLDSRGHIAGEGWNTREVDGDPLAHAEIAAMREAAAHGWNLADCTLVVTLEPCPMCAGAIGWAQLPRIVYGAPDEKRGFRRYAPQVLHPKAVCIGGVLEEECRTLMQDFFRRKR